MSGVRPFLTPRGAGDRASEKVVSRQPGGLTPDSLAAIPRPSFKHERYGIIARDTLIACVRRLKAPSQCRGDRHSFQFTVEQCLLGLRLGLRPCDTAGLVHADA